MSIVLHHANTGLTWGKIFIDGIRTNSDSPSWSGELPVGNHKVTADAPCCIPESRDINVKAGSDNPQMLFRLRSKPATLSVSSELPCEIWLNGIRRASCAESIHDPVAVPLPQGVLKGPVSFLLVRPGLNDLTVTETFEAGRRKILHVGQGSVVTPQKEKRDD